MKIVNCRKSRVTGERLREMVLSRLRDKDVLVNLGWGQFDESEYEDWDVINRVGAIKRCVDKKKMLELLRREGVQCLIIPQKRRFGRKYACKYGKRLRVRRFSRLFGGRFGNYDYVTEWEDKKEEYRVVVFRGKVLRAMRKEPRDGDMDKVLKQSNCRYRHIEELSDDVRFECIKACVVLGIDLAGVDILVNRRGDVRVIEVNSGMGMGSRTCGRLLKEIERRCV